MYCYMFAYFSFILLESCFEFLVLLLELIVLEYFCTKFIEGLNVLIYLRDHIICEVNIIGMDKLGD